MDRLPPLRLLTTFETVARLGSMRQAAERLNVTQPAISQALKSLEDHVGTALFDRSTRPASLTEAGQILSNATRDGLGQISAALEDIRNLAGNDDQHVTVACTLGMATYWLMPKLPDFYMKFSDISINVQAPSTDLPQLAPGVDVAVRYGRGGWHDGETQKLFDEQIYVAGTPDLIAKLQWQGTGLETMPLIHVRSPHNPHWASWDDYFRRRGIKRQRMNGPSFNNYVQASQAALSGLGLMLGWKSITGASVNDGVLAKWPDSTIEIGTSYFVTHATPASHNTKKFVDWIMSSD